MVRGKTFPENGKTHHEMVSYSEGEWVVLVCRTCGNYEKRYNTRTGEIRVRHSGFSKMPLRLQPA